jgi:hypothetical protein
MKAFVLFVLINILDFILTYNGLRIGALEEANVLIILLSKLHRIEIFVGIILLKIISVSLAYWFIFSFGKIKIEGQSGWLGRYFKDESNRENLVVACGMVYAYFGVIPGIIKNVIIFL